MSPTRRQLLASMAGATAAGAIAGTRPDTVVAAESAGQSDDGLAAEQDESAWEMYGADAANTGFHPNTTGPQSDVGPAWEFETSGRINASPAVVDGTVYVASGDGSIYAIDADGGEERWRFDAGNDIRSSPAVVDGTLYVGTQAGTVYALDVEEGEQQWRFGTGGAVPSSPAVVDGTVYVGSQDQRVYAIDATEGAERWQFETEFWVESSPAVSDGVVYVGSDDGTVYALDADDGEEVWTFPTADRVPGSPAVSDGVVYVGSQDQRVYAIDADNGEGRWRFDTGGSVTSSPAVADGVVYVGSRSHSIYAIDTDDGDSLWEFDTGRQVTASPAVTGETVYVASESHEVFGIDTDGEELWRFDTGRPISAAPAVVDETVYVGSENGTVYALEEGEGVATPDGTGVEDEPDDTGGGDQTGEPGGISAFGRALLLPASVVGFATLVVGGYYALARSGLLDPIPSASEVYGGEMADDENESSDPDRKGESAVTMEKQKKSPLWDLVVEDVIARAAETETTARADVVVTKHLDPDTLASPVLAYEIRSVRAEPATIRVVEPLVEFDGESQPLGDSWTVEGDELVYETVLEPGETVTTLVGRRDCSGERADELLEKPDVTVDPQ